MIITKMKVAFKINLYFLLFLINKVFGMCVFFYFVVFRSDGNNVFQVFFIFMNICHMTVPCCQTISEGHIIEIVKMIACG